MPAEERGWRFHTMPRSSAREGIPELGGVRLHAWLHDSSGITGVSLLDGPAQTEGLWQVHFQQGDSRTRAADFRNDQTLRKAKVHSPSFLTGMK